MAPLKLPRDDTDDPFITPPKSKLIKVGKNYFNPKYVSHIECFHNDVIPFFNFIVYMISFGDNYPAEIPSDNYETEAFRDKALDNIVNRLPM